MPHTRRSFLKAGPAAALAARSGIATPLAPRIEVWNGRQILLVDGQPFLILGLQWDCDSCFASEIMDPLFPEAAKLGCNTAVLPLYWREIEPREGKFSFGMLDRRVELARRNGLRLVLNWFGAYKNACLNYAPDFVKADLERFRRVRTEEGKALRNFACPACDATLAADRKAIEAVCGRLRDLDGSRHTVVLLQMENEAGILGTDRCHCPVCAQRFDEGGWRARYQQRAAEAFSAHCMAAYLDRMTVAAKAVHPLPVCINAWLRGEGGAPGKSYPSGGPVDRVLDIYAAAAPHVDFIAPDIYTQDLEQFRAVCLAYSAKGRPLYVAEHASGKTGRAERNVFYALAGLGALGFSPWAIDRPFPDEYGRPLVHQLDHRWSEEAYDLRDSFLPIRDAMVPLAMAQNTGRLQFFVEEQGETECRLAFDDVAFHATYRHPKGMARGIVVRRSEGEFLVIGVGFDARFLDRTGRGIPLARVDRGRFERDIWRTVLPHRRESEDFSAPFRMIEPQVVRAVIEARRS
ncbi:MAG TPA: DUF5597 domain-containing protein [Bryobacteraceae bacterium]|nr:DUF5597 domain-containing protein [Bryobacteraceae bacterium]